MNHYLGGQGHDEDAMASLDVGLTDSECSKENYRRQRPAAVLNFQYSISIAHHNSQAQHRCL